MDGRPERRNRGSSSIFRLVQCLLFLIPYWGIFQLHKRLNLGITEEYSILQDLLEIPPILTNDVVTTTGGRYLAANTDTSRISLKGTKHKVHASLPDSYREIYRKNRQAEELREKAKSRARRYRILARQKQALRDAEREASAWHYRYDEETDAPEPEFEGIPTYVPVGKPKKQVQLEKTSNATHPSKYAYAFVMGGVNEADGKYKGMLYNILIAAYILDKEGSVADVVVYIQMSANSTRTELPEEDSALLKKVNVQVRYLPKPKIENFHQIIMQKMVVLDLVEYRRVLFLDTDVMPFCNLDYVFELSDGSNPVLKENLIIALSGSPANAGKFYSICPFDAGAEMSCHFLATDRFLTLLTCSQQP